MALTTEQANKLALAAISEASWQSTVVHHVQQSGHMVYFIPDKMWRRAFVSGHGQKLGDRGFPDLVIVGRDHLLFRELKKMGGTLSKPQKVWRDSLLASGADWDMWFPSDLETKVIPTLWGQTSK